MAKRKRYPSDHRRWFRVMEDILDDPKLAACSPAECWLFICLLATANRMKSRDGIITIPKRTITALARVRDWNVARTRLERVASVALLGHKQDGACHTITLYKWAEIQGFAPTKLRRDSDETPATTPTPTPTPTKESRKKDSQRAKDDNACHAIPPQWARLVLRINETFALYDGPQIRRFPTKRQRRAETIAREYGPPEEIICKAIHGYVCRNGTVARDDFDAAHYFELDSIACPAHLDANLQACEEAIRRGKSKPFKRGDHTGRRDGPASPRQSSVEVPRRETPTPPTAAELEAAGWAEIGEWTKQGAFGERRLVELRKMAGNKDPTEVARETPGSPVSASLQRDDENGTNEAKSRTGLSDMGRCPGGGNVRPVAGKPRR